MIPDARIVHRLPGRLRIKVDSHKRDVAFFSMLSNQLLSCPGVLGVTASPVTASVLITYDTGRIMAEDGGRRLRSVMHEQLPDLDAEMVIQWLDGTARRWMS